MRVSVSSAEIRAEFGAPEPEVPKYVGPLLNLANQYAQATRPRVVGQMTDLIQQFPGHTLDEWREWYRSQKPGAIDTATQKLLPMVERFAEALRRADAGTIRDWVEDLVLTKTFVGLRCQEAILARLAATEGTEYRLATPEEESRGIDGFVGDRAVSIKPETYDRMAALPETIGAAVVVYYKTRTGIEFELR
jgi:hypothetical protein